MWSEHGVDTGLDQIESELSLVEQVLDLVDSLVHGCNDLLGDIPPDGDLFSKLVLPGLGVVDDPRAHHLLFFGFHENVLLCRKLLSDLIKENPPHVVSLEQLPHLLIHVVVFHPDVRHNIATRIAHGHSSVSRDLDRHAHVELADFSKCWSERVHPPTDHGGWSRRTNVGELALARGHVEVSPCGMLNTRTTHFWVNSE